MQSEKQCNTVAFDKLNAMQQCLDLWFTDSSRHLTLMHSQLSSHLREAETALIRAKDAPRGGDVNAAAYTPDTTAVVADAVTTAAAAAGTQLTAENSGSHFNVAASTAPAAEAATEASQPTVPSVAAVARPAATATAAAKSTTELSHAAAPFNYAAVAGSTSQLSVSHVTPVRSTLIATADATPGVASPPVTHALNYDALITEIDHEISVDHAGATTEIVGGNGATATTTNGLMAGEHFGLQPLQHQPTSDDSAAFLVTDSSTVTGPWHVLVEFKRKRVLQFESKSYVAPGEYVVVAGDRGENIGYVTYAWPTQTAPPAHVTNWSGVGVGEVTRVATQLEISQLQGVQAELETRARDVAQQKVTEHALPMRVVDAEYQFDRKKLTFYYQSQHRLDFRNLVRDLYKTFRARIWMELE